ncbi:MAG: bifunctional precorrin-2 dehydrogenase/sirohydrochlorin ferrochelatase, partial [Porticoccaceae bacterium]
MDALPLFHRVRGERCVLVGGGEVARRKLELLLATGAAVTIVAPECDAGIAALADQGRVAITRRRFRAADLDGAVLAVAATDDPVTNRAVSRAAKTRGIPVNVVDQPELCTVTF